MKFKNLRYLKQFGVSLILLCMLLILTGCGSKSSFPLSFEQFNIKIYNNEKVYVQNISETAIEWMTILNEMKEKAAENDTWFVNSLFIIQIPVLSGTSMQELVDANTKELQLKLLKYTQIDNSDKKIKCKKQEYPWYITTFSYQLGEETLYSAQYYLLDDQKVYVLSLSSDEEEDISRFTKSTKNINCK